MTRALVVALLLLCSTSLAVAQKDTLRAAVGDSLPATTHVKGLTPGCVAIAGKAFCFGNFTPPDTHPLPPDTTTPPPDTTAGTLAFHSTWPVDGNTYAIVHDNGKWNDQLCEPTNPRNAVLVEAKNRAFQWTYDRSTGTCYMIAIKNRFAAPAPGGAAFYRFYYVNNTARGNPLFQNHWFQVNGVIWEFKVTDTDAANKFALRLVFSDASGLNDWYAQNYYSPPLSINTSYRIEIRQRRLTTTTAKIAIRVYSAAGQLVADNSSMHQGVPGDSRAATLASADPVYPVTAASFTNFDLGNNGAQNSNGTVGAGFGTMSAADFAIRVSTDTSAWIGTYSPAATAAFTLRWWLIALVFVVLIFVVAFYLGFWHRLLQLRKPK